MTDSEFRKHQRKASRARWAKVSKAHRSAAARHAVAARWAKWLKEHPDKAPEALARRAKRKAKSGRKPPP